MITHEIYYDEVTFTKVYPRFNLTAIGLGKSMVSEIRLMAPFFPPPSSQPQRKSKVTSCRALSPIGFILEAGDNNYTDPGDGGDHVDHNDTYSEGIPVFSLAVTQSETLTDGLAGPGNYAVDIYIDHATGVEIKELVVVDEFAGLWSPVLDEFEYPIVYPISSVSFPNVSDIDDYFYTEGLQPIGFIQVDDHNYTDPDHGGGDNNYTDPVTAEIMSITTTLTPKVFRCSALQSLSPRL